MAQSFDPNAPRRPVPGKPITQSFPTPNLADRILTVHKDTRAGVFRMPAKGDRFDGPNAKEFEDFKFATARPSDQTGWMDLFYLNERANQDEYNFLIDYPYADKDYPRYTRTYVLLREDVVEPEADDLDPVFNGDQDLDDIDESATALKLYLTDHKQVRLEDPILDALFVGVTRVYERLPGPVITTYGQNDVKQVVTTETQAVLTEDLPVTSDALTEAQQTERTSTAKAVATKSRVPAIYPRLNFEKNWDTGSSPPVPIEFRSHIPYRTFSQIVAGTPAMPDLLPGEARKIETQVTEFTKQVQTTTYEIVHVELDDARLNEQGQVVQIHKILDPAGQTVDEGALVSSSKVDSLGDGASVKETHTTDEVWPGLEASTELPDLLPPEFRALVPTTTHGENVEGQVEDPPTLQPGEVRRREQQQTRFVKRVEITKRDLDTLPRELVDKKLTEQYGGGILEILRVVDQVVMEPDEGYDVVDSFIRNLGDGVVVKETQRVEGGVWPTLYGSETEKEGPMAGVRWDYDKTYVPANTPNPGGYTDMTPHDKWRTIQITSRLDLTSLPVPETFVSTANIDIPPTLLEITGVFSNWGHKSMTAQDGEGSARATVKVSTNASGTFHVKRKLGYNGPAKALVTRYVFPSAPSLVQIPNPTIILPAAGTVSVREVQSGADQAYGVDFGHNGTEGRLSYATADLPPMLTGSYILSNLSFTSPMVSASASATDRETNEIYRAQLLIPGSPASLIISIPMSTPGSIASGQQILVEAPIKKWRFGVYVMEVVIAIVP